MDELEDIFPLLRETNIEHYKIIMMFLLTGMRASELTRLTNEDIDFKNNKLYIRNHKGHRVDQFPLDPKLLNFLIENFELKEGKVWTGRTVILSNSGNGSLRVECREKGL